MPGSAHLWQSDTTFFFFLSLFHFLFVTPVLALTYIIGESPSPPSPPPPPPPCRFLPAVVTVLPGVRPILYRQPPTPSAGIQPSAALDCGSGTASRPPRYREALDDGPHRKRCLRGKADLAGSAQSLHRATPVGKTVFAVLYNIPVSVRTPGEGTRCLCVSVRVVEASE